ncbi:unnamed protein product [Ixodes pacificus]
MLFRAVDVKCLRGMSLFFLREVKCHLGECSFSNRTMSFEDVGASSPIAFFDICPTDFLRGAKACRRAGLCRSPTRATQEKQPTPQASRPRSSTHAKVSLAGLLSLLVTSRAPKDCKPTKGTVACTLRVFEARRCRFVSVHCSSGTRTLGNTII